VCGRARACAKGRAKLQLAASKNTVGALRKDNDTPGAARRACAVPTELWPSPLCAFSGAVSPAMVRSRPFREGRSRTATIVAIVVVDATTKTAFVVCLSSCWQVRADRGVSWENPKVESFLTVTALRPPTFCHRSTDILPECTIVAMW